MSQVPIIQPRMQVPRADPRVTASILKMLGLPDPISEQANRGLDISRDDLTMRGEARQREEEGRNQRHEAGLMSAELIAQDERERASNEAALDRDHALSLQNNAADLNTLVENARRDFERPLQEAQVGLFGAQAENQKAQAAQTNAQADLIANSLDNVEGAADPEEAAKIQTEEQRAALMDQIMGMLNGDVEPLNNIAYRLTDRMTPLHRTDVGEWFGNLFRSPNSAAAFSAENDIRQLVDQINEGRTINLNEDQLAQILNTPDIQNLVQTFVDQDPQLFREFILDLLQDPELFSAPDVPLVPVQN